MILFVWATLGQTSYVIRPIASVAAATINTLLTNGMIRLFTENPYTVQEMVSHLPANILLAQLLEATVFMFVLPRIDHARGLGLFQHPASQKSDAQAAFSMTVGGEAIPIDKLLYVESIEHYLRIVTCDGEKVIRARVADVVSQTNKAHGVQPHRSWWVSDHAAQKLVRRTPNDVLRLIDGTEIRVARGRREDVRGWFEAKKSGARQS